MAQDDEKRHYRVDSWIRVDTEEVEVHGNIADAEAELRHCEFMSPEDRFEIVECDEKGGSL